MKQIAVGNSLFQKQANSLLILNALRTSPLSRTEIAARLGLQPSTVTYSVGRLLESDIVKETGPSEFAAAGAGRKRSLLRLNADYGCFGGAHITDKDFRIVISDLFGTILSRKIVNFSEKEAGFEQKVSGIVACCTDMAKGKRILGLGISVPGVVNSEGNTIRECWSMGIWDKCFSKLLDSFSFPVRLENDARLGAKKYQSEESLAYLLARRSGDDRISVGIGLVLGGRLYRGDNGRSGEYRSSALMRCGALGRTQVRDEADARSAVMEILSDVLSLMTTLDIAHLVADFEPDMRTIAEGLVANELKNALQSIGVGIRFSDSEWNSAEGGSSMMLAEFFAVPQVGQSIRNKNCMF